MLMMSSISCVILFFEDFGICAGLVIFSLNNKFYVHIGFDPTETNAHTVFHILSKNLLFGNVVTKFNFLVPSLIPLIRKLNIIFHA